MYLVQSLYNLNHKIIRRRKSRNKGQKIGINFDFKPSGTKANKGTGHFILYCVRTLKLNFWLSSQIPEMFSYNLNNLNFSNLYNENRQLKKLNVIEISAEYLKIFRSKEKLTFRVFTQYKKKRPVFFGS